MVAAGRACSVVRDGGPELGHHVRRPSPRAMLMALNMAFALDEPWLMMHTPRTPRAWRHRSCRAPGSRRRVEGRSQRLELGRQLVRGGEGLLDRTHDGRERAFEGLEHDVAAESSVTTMSTSSVRMSRPSTLPMNVTPAPFRRVGSFTSVLPLVFSSPIDSRPTFGAPRPKRWRAKTEPICANCTSHSGWHSAFAAAVQQHGRPGASRDGQDGGDGRPAHPLIRPMRNSAEPSSPRCCRPTPSPAQLPSRTASAA